MSILSRTPPKRQSWISTRWSMVAGLHAQPEIQWQASWRYLVETYRAPMERYVRAVLSRRTGQTNVAEQAKDIVQDFLTTCFEKEWLARADPDRGRFRAYAKKLLRRYALGYVRKEKALKRSPAPGKQTFEIREGDRVENLTPDEQAELDEFDRSWFKVAFDRALQRLGEERERYQIVILDLQHTGGEGSDDLAERVGVRRQQLPVLVHRARKRMRHHFVEELAQTVGDQDLFEEEYKELLPYMV